MKSRKKKAMDAEPNLSPLSLFSAKRSRIVIMRNEKP
jgi:hypothetical protein